MKLTSLIQYEQVMTVSCKTLFYSIIFVFIGWSKNCWVLTGYEDQTLIPSHLLWVSFNDDQFVIQKYGCPDKLAIVGVSEGLLSLNFEVVGHLINVQVLQNESKCPIKIFEVV